MCISQIIGFAMIIASAVLYLWLAKRQRKYDAQKVVCHFCGATGSRVAFREYLHGKWACEDCAAQGDEV